MSGPDAVVVGSGPNGLAAAVTLARSGLSVEVFEGAEVPGGGCRTSYLTIPGFRHDVCSAVHPLGAASPFFRGVDLAARGVRFRTPTVSFAHPLGGGRAAAVVGSVDRTAQNLGTDAVAYRRLFSGLVRDGQFIESAMLAPLRSVPAHPLAVARFGLRGLQSATSLAQRFATDEARALFAGVAAHSMLPLTEALTGAFGLLLTEMAHSVGWPIVEGGSGRIVEALVQELESLGGHIRSGVWVRTLQDLPMARVTMLDVSPRGMVQIADRQLPPSYRRALEAFGYGPGVCKVDWALGGRVPWEAEQCTKAGTVHLGGTLAEVSRSEADVAAGRHPEYPYCIVAQPGVVDPTRAPEGGHTLWGYCHVPAGSSIDMTERIEAQIERFAPGFRDLILGRATMTADQCERYNPNYVGGAINGGAATIRQMIFRPTLGWKPYRTALRGVYLCSASTPPGGGVHGMCGFGAAQAALADLGTGTARRPTATRRRSPR